MAYVNGNKPIVTNGLIYALDFGNTRSYNSGSTTAKSLAFDQATTSVSGSPIFNNGILDFTSTKFIKRDGSLSALDPNGTFTVMIVGNAVSSSGTLLKQDSLNATLSTTGSLFGFGLESGDFSRSYPGFTSSSLQHVTYRYSQGTIDTFINGIPVTASAANSALTTTAVSNALFLGSGSVGFSGSLAQFYVYNRALSSDEIYETYLVSAERNGLPTISKPYSIDENVYKYVQTTGITDNNTISAISTFVSDLKSNGLWNKMTAIYPFLTTATASQAVNLKDPGVLAVDYSGSYIASSTGPVPATATDYIDLTGIRPTYAYPGINSGSSHFTALSYDPQSQVGFLGGTSLPALGGDVVIASGSKILHAFKTVGTSSFTMLNPAVTNVEVMVVAGGGGGGSSKAGGGGAGGLVYSSSFVITPGANLQVIIGNGGGRGVNGQNSVFDTITAFGGGYGGRIDAMTPGNGGSGGGAGGMHRSGDTATLGGTGVSGQGNNGGNNYPSQSLNSSEGGGGGGAGGPGQDASATLNGGAGGSGSYYPQFSLLGGSPAGWFAGGGGKGVAYSGTPGPGGIGGGATGAVNGPSPIVQPGVSNTGGGGAGGAIGGSAQGGTSGGSGIVIVSYDLPATALTGSGTGLYITEDAITGSVNNGFTAGITGSGTIGFLTVSRTGSNSYSLRKNNQQATINLAASASLTTDFFLGGANLAGNTNLSLPARIAYASVGAGLTDSEVSTYYNLVSQFQTNLKRQNTLLDNYSGAAAAYSLRRIGPSGYFGPAIRVRRDSDNSLRDIGFTSDGQLDTVGLLDFVGVTGSGFVQTWYDQSGNGNNATQATAGSQPLVVTSGSIYSEGNKIAPLFLGAQSLTFTNIPPTPNSTYIGVGKKFTSTSYQSFVAGTDLLPAYLSVDNLNRYIFNVDLEGGSSNTQIADPLGRRVLIGLARGETDQQLYDNGNLIPISYGPDGRDRNNLSIIGNGGGVYVGRFTNGTIQEVLIYNTDQSSNRTAIESNINNNYKIFGSATASFDSDYQAFITATGITEPTQSAALETLVSDLKSYGLWSKMKAVYPMVTDRNNRFAQSEDFSSTWNAESASVAPNQTTAPNGTLTADLILDITSSVPAQTFTVVNNGASAYTIDGVDNPVLTLQRGKTYDFNIDASGHPFYIMTGSGAYSVDGQYNTGVTGQGTQTGTLRFVVPNDAPDTLAYVCQFHSSMGNTITVNENSDQHYIYQTIDGDTGIVTGSEYVLSTYAKFYNTPYIAFKTNTGAQAWFDVQTGVTGSYTGSNATITNVGNGWYRCALYFTSSVATGPYNQQIHLARTNNDLTFAGTGTSGSYLWGAQFENGNLLGPYRKTEGSGFAVSGSNSMLDQMKFNLKNSADTDAAFRLVYSGSWNPGYSGIKSDAQVGTYIDTKLNPSQSLGLNDAHLAVYSNTATNLSTMAAAGAVGSSTSQFNIVLSGPNISYKINSDNTNVGSSVDNNLLGFTLANRISSTETRNARNLTLIQRPTPSTTSPNKTLWIGDWNYEPGNYYPSDLQYTITTIGDGLTDYEAKALYWIVQKFQTTLGRQVY